MKEVRNFDANLMQPNIEEEKRKKVQEISSPNFGRRVISTYLMDFQSKNRTIKIF